MKHDVLERNVRLLMRRSYVPALPAPHFRDRLESLFLGEIQRRAKLRGAPARVGRRLVLALAAVVLGLLAGWRLFRVEDASTRASLIARGEIALGLPDGSWRRAEENERSNGVLFAPPSLVAVTPSEAELEVLVGVGRIHLDPGTELALERRTDANEITATLRSGRAWFLLGEDRTELEAGTSEPLRTLHTVPTTALLGSTGGEREDSTPAVGPDALEAPAPPALTGRVVDAETGEAILAFEIGLLRERIHNETYPPTRRVFESPDGTFRWPAPPTGKQRAFVFAEGYALCALGEFDLSGELPILEAALERGIGVEGSVLDGEGNPISGALIFSEHRAPTDGLLLHGSEYLFWLPVKARSGPDGRFRLDHLLPGRHTLRASAAGYATAWASGLSLPTDRNEPLVMTLGAGGTIEGKVTREDGGAWADVQVLVLVMERSEATHSNFATTRTDGEGKYRFEHMPPTTVIVVLLRDEALAANPGPEVRPVQVLENQTIRVDFAPPKRGILLHGFLLRGGQPVPRQNIGLFDATTSSFNADWVASTTREDGSYAFEGVEPGHYLIFLIDEMGRGMRCVDELELAVGTLDVEHEVWLSGSTLEITARAEDDSPARQAVLIMERLTDGGELEFAGYGLCDERGAFTFVDLRAGSYEVTAFPSTEELGFVTSGALEVITDQHTSSVLRLPPGGAVDVRVLSSDGRALEGALVLFQDEDGIERLFSSLPLSDSSGLYHARGLRPGRYSVGAHLAGYEGTPVTFHYELGVPLEIPVLLAPLPPR